MHAKLAGVILVAAIAACGSCKGRGLCPSCGAKRAAIFSEMLQHQILAAAPHAQWVFSIPKMLSPTFSIIESYSATWHV